MFRSSSNASHTVLGAVPELNYVLLRDNGTNKVEAWTRSRGVLPLFVIIDGHELEFVREVSRAWRIPDTEYNRKHVPHEIGRIYVDEYPLGAELQELR